jgi:hypothetical protein
LKIEDQTRELQEDLAEEIEDGKLICIKHYSDPEIFNILHNQTMKVTRAVSDLIIASDKGQRIDGS